MCLEPIHGGAGDWRLGCECIIHFHCFVSYLASRLDDRLTMALDGVACPYGDSCRSQGRGTPYFVTLQDLDSVADASAAEALSRILADNQVDPLTHEQVQNLREWIGEEKEEVRRRGDSRMDDPFVLATTKPCPSCGFRSTHAHGHACHHISPALAPKRGGCPACHVNYCYRCLSSEADNVRLRGANSSCVCGCWSNFCSPITTMDDVECFVRFTDGIPFDIRCGCAICPDCRKDRPCGLCSGSCSVCKGFLNPGPSGIIRKGEAPWVAVRPLDLTSHGHPWRIFKACETGDTAALLEICQEVHEAGQIFSSDLDKVDGFKRWDWRRDVDDYYDGDDDDYEHEDDEEEEGLFVGCEALEDLIGCWKTKFNEGVLDYCISELASSPGHLNFFRTLLQLPGIGINKLDLNNETPLTLAIRRASLNEPTGDVVLDSVRAILEDRKVRVNKPNLRGLTPLMVSANQGCAGALELLLRDRHVRLNIACTLNTDMYGSTALSLALEKVMDNEEMGEGESSVLELLLADRRLKPNTKNTLEETALLRLVRSTANFPTAGADTLLPPVIDRLLQVPGIQPNLEDRLGDTPIGLAIKYNYPSVLRQLASFPHVNLQFQDCKKGYSYLMMAVDANRLEILSALLSSRLFDINAVDKKGATALSLAASKRAVSEPILRALLAAPGVSKNLANTKGQTPLALACLNNNPLAISILLADELIDVNRADDSGMTPLSFLVSNGHTALVATLLGTQYLNLSSRDQHGLTCLDMAVRGGHVEIVQLLLAAYLPEAVPEWVINNRPKDGITCLQAACELTSTDTLSDVVAAILAVSTTDINVIFQAKDGSSSTALLTAAEKGATKLLKSLLRNRTLDVNLTFPPDRLSALMITSSFGFVKCTRAILAHPELKVNQQDTGGRTALWWAFYVPSSVAKSAPYISWRQSCVELLLAHPHIDINLPDKQDCTPLAMACKLDNPILIRLLADRPEADLNVVEKNGSSLIDLAGSQSVRALLRERGCTRGGLYWRLCDNLC